MITSEMFFFFIMVTVYDDIRLHNNIYALFMFIVTV